MIGALLFLAISAAADPSVHLHGTLLERGTRKPLAHVNIYCFPGEETKPLKTESDAKGEFALDVPAGPGTKLRWTVALAGYERLVEEDTVDGDRDRTLYLEKASYSVYETTVYGQTEKRDDKTQSLDQSQFLTMPGANGDPVKAIQNLPGINRPNALSAQVIIEGSSPFDTRYDIDDLVVPIIFHLGGLSSVVIPEAVDHVDYLSAGFGPEYGNTTAGYVNLGIRDPQTDRVHGFAFVDLLNAGGLVEGPLGESSSFLVGGRQSYIGFVLALVAKGDKDFNLTVAPDFEDTIVELKSQVTPIDTFRLVATASRDTLAFVLTEPAKQDPSIRGSFDSETAFFRLMPEWTHRHSSRATMRVRLGLGKDWNRIDIGDFFSHTATNVVTGRAETEIQLTDSWKSYWGIDEVLNWSAVDFQLPFFSGQGGVGNPIAISSERVVSKTYGTGVSAAYWRNVIHAPDSRLTLIPGARLNYYSVTAETIAEPRLAARYALDDGLTLRAATGLYSEAPPVNDLDPLYGNPALKSQRAIHLTAGFEKDFRGGSSDGLVLSDDVFYKYIYDIVADSTAFVTPSQPLYYDNSGYGHAFGNELLLKYRAGGWEGWLAYTLSRSSRGSALEPEQIYEYDQTHILTAVGSRELGSGWKLSARVRYTTGDPYTPIVGGTFDADNDIYLPVSGDIYSKRLAPFFEVDARLDKKWIYDRWMLTLYLDVENVTNHSNPQAIQYSYDYATAATVNGLPVFPTLGLKGEF